MLDSDKMPGMAVIDLEASGLHRGSFPIEVGWCFGDLRSGSFLIRPHSSWHMDDWRAESEAVHGIPQEKLHKEGIEAHEAARFLNDTLGGYILLTDAPAYDGMWLQRLFDAAGVDPTFMLRDYKAVFGQVCRLRTADEINEVHAKVQKLFTYNHRAEKDALFLTAFLLSVGGCYDEIVETLAKDGHTN